MMPDPFTPSPEVLLERHILQLAMTIMITSHAGIKEVLQEAHDKLCAMRKPEQSHE